MKIDGIIWLDDIVEKLIVNHHVEIEEVEEMLANEEELPKFRFVEKGEWENEDIYLALGQTEAGRYLIALFIHKTKENNMAESELLPISEATQKLSDDFDTQDFGDVIEQMPEAHFDVNIQRKTYLVSVDESTMKTLVNAAQKKKTPIDILINDLLKAKAGT